MSPLPISPAAPSTPAGVPRPGAASAAADEPERRFSLELRLDHRYLQVADFGLDDVEPLVVDEPPPLGEAAGPNPARLLGAAVGSCLGASLLYCLRRARVEVGELRTTVDGTLVRNAQGRLRVGALRVRLAPTLAEADRPRLARCLGLFEEFCVVTESVRQGIEVDVQVAPRASRAGIIGDTENDERSEP